MTNQSLSLLFIDVALLQIVIALFWLFADRDRSFARWFAGALLLFGVRNLTQALVLRGVMDAHLQTELAVVLEPPLWGFLLAGIFGLYGWRRLQSGLLRLLAGVVVVGVITLLIGQLGLVAHPDDQINPLLFWLALMGGLVVPLLSLVAGLIRRDHPERRNLQLLLLLFLVAGAVVEYFVRTVPGFAASNFAGNTMLSLGLVLIMLSSSSDVLDRLGRPSSNLPIRTKLLLGFGTLIAIVLSVSLLSGLALFSLNRTVQQTLSTQNELVELSGQLSGQYRDARRYERDFALTIRASGVDVARSGPYVQWQRSIEEMEGTITAIERRVPTDVTNPQRQRAEDSRRFLGEYVGRAEPLFSSLEQRGDSETGALANWLAQAEVLDQNIDERRISSNELNDRFVALRTNQFYYLVTESTATGEQIEGLYDEIQEFLLFGPSQNIPLSTRTQIQTQVGLEAAAFRDVRHLTRALVQQDINVNKLAEDLEEKIEEFETQANSDFDSGVQQIDNERINSFLGLLLVATLGALLAYMLARVISRQIVVPLGTLASAAERIAGGDYVRAEVSTRDELGATASAFNTMTERLQGLLNTLELRVQRRTQQLETAAQVSASASQFRDLSELLDSTVKLLVDSFEDIYHAQVFLVDPNRRWGVLRASTGNAGRQLLANNHRLDVGGQSVIGKVTSSGDPVLARVADPYSVHKPNPLLPDTKSELALPLRWQGQIIGALDVQSLRHYAFSDDEVRVLQTLADQLAIAVQNARFIRDLGETVNETEMLFRASSRLASASNEQEVLDAFMSVAEQLKPADRLSVLLFDEFDADGLPTGLLSAQTWTRDEGITLTGHRFSIAWAWPMMQQARQQGLLEIPYLDPEVVQDGELLHIFEELGTRSVALLPLQTTDNFLGLLILQRKEAGEMPEKALRILQTLAQQAAIALNRFALLKQLGLQVDELDALRRSFLDLGAATSLSGLLDTLAERATTLLEAHASTIYLHREPEHTMTLVALHNMNDKLLGTQLQAGEGAAGQMILRPQPLIVDNYATWASHSERFPGVEKYGAVAAAPLFWKNQLLGALVVVNQREQRGFSQDDLRRLTLFADQASLAIENSRLLDETERTLRETEQLYQTSQAMIAATNEQDLLRAVVRSMGVDQGDAVAIVRTVSNADPAQLELVSANEVQLVVRERPERRTRSFPEVLPLGTRLPGSLLVPGDRPLWELTPQTRIVNNLSASEWPDELRIALSYGFQSMLIVPIFIRDFFYGAILVLRRKGAPFQHDEATRYNTLASQFAVAYDNLLLLAETRRAADRLATAAEVSRTASTQLDVGEVLNRAVNLIREKFGYYHTQVFLVDEGQRWAELRASTGDAGRQLLERQHRLEVGGRSVIGQVTARGEHVVAQLADEDAATVHRRNELLPNTQAELALPMKIGERVIGALDVQSTELFAFDDAQEIEILQSLADQLAVAVQNARLFERTQQNLAFSQTLYNAGRAVASAETRRGIVQAIAEHLAPPDTLDVSAVSIHWDDEGKPDHFRVEAIYLPPHPTVDLAGREYQFSADQHPFLQTLRDATDPLVIHDILHDPRMDPISRAKYVSLGIHAFAAVPLTRINGVQWLLQLSLPQARRIRDNEVESLRAIASQAGVAFDNLTLLDNLEERAERLSQTNDLASRLLAAESLETLLATASQEITELLEADQTVFTFYDWPSDSGTVVSHFHRDETESALGVQIQLSTSPTTQAMRRTGRPVLVPDVKQANLSDQVRAELLARGQRSIVVSPLQVRGDMIGSFLVARAKSSTDGTWGSAEVALAQTLSNLVASAIDSTRLFEQIRHTLQQTQSLYRASRAINEAGSLDDIARAIAVHMVDDPSVAVSLLSFQVDANEVIRGAQVEGAYLSLGDASRVSRLAFSESTLPVLTRLNISREPLAVANVPTDERLSKREARLFRYLGVGSFMAVPIRLPDGWRGAIMVSYPEKRPIAEDDVERLAAISTQAATTMQNRELLVRTQESLLESQLLYQVGTAINEAETAEALLEALGPLLRDFQPDQSLLLLFDEPVMEGERPINFSSVAGVNHRQELVPLGQTYRVRDFPIFRRLPVTQPLLFEDVQASEQVSAEEKVALKQLGVRALLYLPLRIGTRYMGWIGFNAGGARTIGETTSRRLQTIAQQAATALQSQQLFQEAQRRAWREEQISRITARLHSSTEPEEIMRIGLQELKRTLKIKRAMAWTEEHEPAAPGNGAPGRGRPATRPLNGSSLR